MAEETGSKLTYMIYGPLFIGLFVTLFVILVGYYWVKGCNSMPNKKEGFAGPVRGAGVPDCLHTLNNAAFLYEKLSSRITTTETGSDDLREMQVLLGKLACFKRDLMGVAQVVQATYGQPFANAHDMEPVAETTARCFSKTIPQRDLELILEKWGSRGTFLLKRLCTAQNMPEEDQEESLDLFGSVMYDVTDVALGACCNASAGASIAGQPVGRMVGGVEPAALTNLKTYEGYY